MLNRENQRSLVRSAVFGFFAAAIQEAHENLAQERHAPAIGTTRLVVAASSCPALDCGSPVIDYKPADNVRRGIPRIGNLVICLS